MITSMSIQNEKELLRVNHIFFLQALDINRHDAWACHAVAHCKEMTGKYEKGIKFMADTENDWSVSKVYHYCLGQNFLLVD